MGLQVQRYSPQFKFQGVSKALTIVNRAEAVVARPYAVIPAVKLHPNSAYDSFRAQLDAVVIGISLEVRQQPYNLQGVECGVSHTVHETTYSLCTELDKALVNNMAIGLPSLFYNNVDHLRVHWHVKIRTWPKLNRVLRDLGLSVLERSYVGRVPPSLNQCPA